ncbi:hypothetical protein Back11_32070 [Paenibacillus baekrokdamisoli]|uniref:Uncharacterized protein n=1 Tax=Paenibacillus baekrokdamisoli TaxID=1712516 RepID=A0A3G9IUC4_9BACL|nr:hypothetical protein [Paenibacillus baekrokdamisoli]MBB3071628.1 hypothetical protein [Paenibacillus baekrokdamisoli]BBH21862.1 hypothetical protein Back11_32070 [Paenibacillus baekrokdamisoli]
MLLPVESKQISFCSYDETESTLQLYYHTGEIVVVPSVHQSDYQSILHSANRYDTLMEVTQKGQTDDVLGVVVPEMGAPAVQDI